MVSKTFTEPWLTIELIKAIVTVLDKMHRLLGSAYDFVRIW